MKTFILAVLTILNINFISLSQPWTQTSGTPEGAGITDMITTANGTIVVTCASYSWPSGQQGGIRISSNSGASWQSVVNAYNGRTLHLGTTGKIFASFWPYPTAEGMYFSTNNGLNWEQSYYGGASDNVFSITSTNNDNTVFIGTRYGVWRSINNGLWAQVFGGIQPNTFVYDLEADSSGTYIAAGTSKGLYVTSNNGNTWSPVSGINVDDTIYAVKFIKSQGDDPEDNFLFSTTSKGAMFKSPESAQYLAAILVYTFLGKIGDVQVVKNADLIYIAGALSPFHLDNSVNAGFVLSSDMGSSWQDINTGLPGNPVVSRITYSISGSNINWHAGLFNNTLNGAKVYKMTTPIGINQISNQVPDGFSLSQNYPNPFNPVTKIKFNVAKESAVNITVFDVLGRHISTLVNEKLRGGSYETEWSAVNIPGGVYFYKIETDDYTETKKMMLVK
jgi:hypothetical protein